jgi:hypothetical protein
MLIIAAVAAGGFLLSTISRQPAATPISHYSIAPSAAAVLHQALAAQGGEQALRVLKSVTWEASGYRNMVEHV